MVIGCAFIDVFILFIVGKTVDSSRCVVDKILTMTDEELIFRCDKSFANERRSLVDTLVDLAAVVRQDSQLKVGYPNSTKLLMERYGFSAAAAKKRLWLLNATMRFPAILDFLSSGRLHVSRVYLLLAHLTQENYLAFLEKAATFEDDVEITWWLVGMFPKEVPDEREKIKPLTKDRAEFSLIVDRQFIDLLNRSREIHKHAVPDESALKIIKRALREDLKRNDPIQRRERRAARAEKTSRPPQAKQPSMARKVPKVTSDEAGIASGDTCNFPGSLTRCTARGGLEDDHCYNHAWGGSSDAANVQKLCKLHNALKGRKDFRRDYRRKT
jgi:hypothetical protein